MPEGREHRVKPGTYVICVTCEISVENFSPQEPSHHPSSMTSESIQDYVLYHPKHRVLICLPCKHAIYSETDGIER